MELITSFFTFSPAHPITTHLPIALALVIPVIMLVMLVSIKKGWWPARVWFIAVVLQAMALGGVYIAQDTGGDDAGVVIEKLGEEPIKEFIHEHAVWSDRLYWTLAGGLAVSFLAFCFPGVCAFRLISLVVAVGAFVPTYYTGHLGGELAYNHGAAAAFVTPEAQAPAPQAPIPGNTAH